MRGNLVGDSRVPVTRPNPIPAPPDIPALIIQQPLPTATQAHKHAGVRTLDSLSLSCSRHERQRAHKLAKACIRSSN